MVRAASGTPYARGAVVKGLLGVVPFLLLLVGGILAFGGGSLALLLIAHAGIVAIVIAAVDAWVLLVEIRR
jgi:hypothetical protein